jgi:NadR type nicotinamide-nucleotide adenylyltransferase
MPDATAIRRIVVSGSESTGKTTLARRLAEWLGTTWVPEYSRTYAELKAVPLDAGDVEPIARGTLAAAAEGERVARGGLLVLDTDLASTLVYARHYYDIAPAWIDAEWRARPPALYLLCHPDVPWVPDGVRDQPRERAHLHALFAAQLATSRAPVVDVRGTDWMTREAVARDAVMRLLGPLPDGLQPAVTGA